MTSVHIDGSYGEGGGQVLRTSLSLAALLGCELTMDNIRAGRSKPGLAAQHVTCVRAAAAVCGAEVEGDDIGSQSLRFRPGAIEAGRYRFDVADVRPSAGSMSLVLQTVLPPLLFASGDSQVTLRGGTNVQWSPCYEYIRGVFLPAIARAGARASIRRTRGGWYPRGGGEMVLEVSALKGALRPFDMQQRGALKSLTVTSTVSAKLPEHIVGRQIKGALEHLPEDIAKQARRVTEQPEGGPGTCLALAVEFEAGNAGASALGERGKPAEKVGAEAAQALAALLQSGAAADVHLADQLLLYAALAEGESVITGEFRSLHLETNAWVIGQFINADVQLEGEAPTRIRVRGVGCQGCRECP